MSRWHGDAGIQTVPNASASAALAQALTLSRRGRTAPLKEQRDGDRIDTRRIARVATGDTRIFVRRGAPAPDRIRVSILVDASSSMTGWVRNSPGEYGASYASTCAQIARDLAGATELLPWVKADVVAFTTRAGDVAMYPLWKSGQPTSAIDSYGNVSMGGTEEGYAIAFAKDELLEARQSREQCLIIIISDGGPSEPAHVKAVVDQCRREKIPVVSVALVPVASQPLMYGHENVIDFDGNSRALARRMAQVIGRVL